MTPDIGPLEAISEGILLLDTAGSVVWFNQRLAELFGFLPEGMREKTREEVLSAMSARMVDAESYVRRVREIIANDEPRARDLLQLKNGRTVERVSSRHFRNGVRVGRILVYRDVTREQQVEAALQHSEARFRKVIAAAPDGVLLSHNWRIIYVNDALAQALGRKPDDLVDTSVLDLLPPEDRGEVHSTAIKIMEREQTTSLRE